MSKEVILYLPMKEECVFMLSKYIREGRLYCTRIKNSVCTEIFVIFCVK